MATCKQKLYAFERSPNIIEELALSDAYTFSDKSFQALHKAYEELIELSSVSDESMINGFLVPQV